jgi:hypothetical protein
VARQKTFSAEAPIARAKTEADNADARPTVRLVALVRILAREAAQDFLRAAADTKKRSRRLLPYRRHVMTIAGDDADREARQRLSSRLRCNLRGWESALGSASQLQGPAWLVPPQKPP